MLMLTAIALFFGFSAVLMVLYWFIWKLPEFLVAGVFCTFIGGISLLVYLGVKLWGGS